jgi:hypothetical protein
MKEFMKRTLLWQIVRMWLGRIRQIKIATIKGYIKNDLEYMKIRREIESFRRGDIYDFNGIRLPLHIISTDAFLNVLKPSIQKIKYTKDSIEKFYEEQKERYRTAIYVKNNYPERARDVGGNHIVCHGFTYFLNEIAIGKNDVVMDLGAAPGDFSALCIRSGASLVYAFEPDENNNSDLEKVNLLNGNKMRIIRKYCRAKTDPRTNSISLDDFVRENNIAKIDLIKADLEGAEAEALMGARNILKVLRPKLSICTYHYMQDEDKIEKAILDANPDYKIYKQKGIIYAY